MSPSSGTFLCTMRLCVVCWIGFWTASAHWRVCGVASLRSSLWQQLGNPMPPIFHFLTISSVCTGRCHDCIMALEPAGMHYESGATLWIWGYKVQTRLMLILIQVFKQCCVGVGDCTKVVPVITWFLTVFQKNSKNLYWYITIVLKSLKLFETQPVKPPAFYNGNWHWSFGNNMNWWFLDSEMLKEPQLWLITELNTFPTLVLTLQGHKGWPVICAILAQHQWWWYAGATKQCIIGNIK